MKRWILDVFCGVVSLILLVVLVYALPMVMTENIAYVTALTMFVLIISTGGYLIRNVPS